MGPMTRPASDSLTVILSRLDARVHRVDEERWLSSRYAAETERGALIVLYAFYYELARVRLSVSDQTLGQIRFQWWRDALAELEQGEVRQHDVVLALAGQIERAQLKISTLTDMVTQFEQAFLANDRAMEPEGLLARAAANLCAPEHEGPGALDELALDWARLRRGEPARHAINRVQVAAPLRPALAHFRLRHAWQRDKKPGKVQTRLSIFLAVLIGSI